MLFSRAIDQAVRSLGSLKNHHQLTLLSISHLQFSKMPKKPAKATKASELPNASESKSPITIGKNGDISISIQVKPGAKVDAITDISETAVGVQISAPPMDGEANTAIIKYFAQLLKVKKTDVSLKGGKSRQKSVLVASSTGLSESSILALLNTEINQR